mmetsp:Transcript_13756/g.14327  ORF Transcript_13756/g.14327 Transcript_13756/m.14327 type:complete len:855 (+) Transcript_13756:710-3274(+)
MMTLRGTITEKETIIETLQKKTSTLNLIELTTEKEEYYQEIQRLKKIIAQKEKELQNEKNTHAWEKKGPITLEDNLRAEITRLSRGYQQVLERLENTAVATNTNVNKPNSPRQSEVDSVKLNRPLSGKSPRGSDASQTKNRPKSAGAKVPITSQNSNDVGYIDPILTTFDHKPSPSLSSSNKSNINQTTTTTTSTSVKGNLSNSTKNDLNNDKSNVKKEADFLYEMSEENVVGIGGESNVESYLTTAKGLSIPPTAPLPLGCKIQVKKRDNNLWEGRVIGFNEQKNTYDIQYDEGGREFDVLRSTIIVVGEQVSQPNITTSLNKNQTTTTTTTTSSSSSQNQPIPQTQNFFQSQNQPQLQPQVQKQQPIQSQTSTSFSSSNNPSPRKEAVIVKNKYQVGDSVEGNYQGGGSWYPGIIIGIIGNKYRVRYQDGDEEGNIIEDNIRLREKDKTSNSILVSNPSPLPEKISTSSEKIDQNENIPIYLPNDKVECRYRGKAKYYPGKIDTVNMDGTYNINYDDGEYEVNVSYIYIKKLGGDNNNFTSSSLPSQPQPQFQLQSSQNNNNNNSGNDSPDQFASQLNSPYPLYAVGNHIEGNYKSKGKWYPGKIGYVVNHGEAYTIEYDDGLIEENVKPINIKLKEVQYNIDSFLNDDDGDDTGGAVGLNTDDLLNDNYFTQLKANQNQNQNQFQEEQSQNTNKNENENKNIEDLFDKLDELEMSEERSIFSKEKEEKEEEFLSSKEWKKGFLSSNKGKKSKKEVKEVKEVKEIKEIKEEFVPRGILKKSEVKEVKEISEIKEIKEENQSRRINETTPTETKRVSKFMSERLSNEGNNNLNNEEKKTTINKKAFSGKIIER